MPKLKEKVNFSNFKSNFLAIFNKIKNSEYKKEKKIEKSIEKIIVTQKNKKKIAKKEIASKFFWILFCIVGCLVIILINPWSYLLFIFLLILWNVGGLFGKLLTIFLLLFIFGSIGIMFFGTDEEREDFFNSRF